MSAPPQKPTRAFTSATARPLTIRDFAATLGVSKTTVSKAFSGSGRIAPATREAILRSARELNFDPNPHAQRLGRGGHSKDLVGLFCPGVTTGGTGAQKCLLVQSLLDQQGLDVPLYTPALQDGSGDRGQVASLRRLRRQRPRAIVCTTTILQDAALAQLKAYQAEGGLVVCFDLAAGDLAADTVIFDRDDNTYQAARHLIERGHRDIGLSIVGRLRVPDRDRHSPPRLTGFHRAMNEAGLVANSAWLFDGDDDEHQGARLAARFLAQDPRPTALCIVNERVASAFLNQVIRAGVRVPGDLSVVSHDDLPVARYAQVPLSTVSQPVEEIASHVANLLARRLDDPLAPPQTVVVRGALVPRQSVADYRQPGRP